MQKIIKNKKTRQKISYDVLRLGRACNVNCLFCNVPIESYNMQDMTTPEVKDRIRALVSLNKNVRLDITGGEPTIRNDLFEIICFARKKGIATIEIQTNGIMLSDVNYVKGLKLAGADKLFVGLHSCYPRIHDYLVSFKGAFERCTAGIKNALKADIKVILNPVINTKNYKGLPDYIKFIKDNFPKIKFISLSVIQPRGRAWNNKYLIPRYKDIGPYVGMALDLAYKHKLIINNPYCGLPLCIGGWHKYLEQCTEYHGNLSKIKRGILYNNDIKKDKIKPINCFRCDFNNYCNGVWREYAALYSFDDIKPIRLKNG